MKKNEKKKQTTIRFRAYATIDREEIFLNEMCEQGWKPVSIFLGIWFKFLKCEPGEYITRITTCVDPKGSKAGRQRREQISEFLTESGAEIIPETNIDADTRIYAVRRADMGDFQINTDIDSLILEYTGRRRYHLTFGALLLSFFVICVLLGCGMLHDPMPSADESFYLSSACVEFVCAALELLCAVVLMMPVPGYCKKIKELRNLREIEE